MLRAILFDFDGVIADTEPAHFMGFQTVLRDVGHTLSKKTYYARYLGYDDIAFFKRYFQDQRSRLTNKLLSQLMKHKARVLQHWLRKNNVLMPGAGRVIKMLSRRYPITVVSGALRQEIVAPLRRADLKDYFSFIVSAEDVKRGKPYPDGFLRALNWLNQNIFSPDWPLRASECLVIEDSHWGVTAAHRAKMPCVGVTTSYSKKEMKAADMILKGINDINVSLLPRLESLTS